MTDAPAAPAAPDGYKADAEGRLVPIASIKPEHMLEDELVRRLVALADAQSAALKAFRENAASEIKAFLDLIADQYGVSRGGKKGNVTFQAYDGSMRIQLAVGEFITFGPELQAAKALIDQCLTDWSASAGSELRTIVSDAFRVNKEGKLDTDAILGLRRHAFEDARWKRAMDAISDSVRVVRSKTYLRFYRRRADDYAQIPLDVARV